jgi:hypothetical protein
MLKMGIEEETENNIWTKEEEHNNSVKKTA